MPDGPGHHEKPRPGEIPITVRAFFNEATGDFRLPLSKRGVEIRPWEIAPRHFEPSIERAIQDPGSTTVIIEGSLDTTTQIIIPDAREALGDMSTFKAQSLSPGYLLMHYFPNLLRNLFH